VGGQRCLGAARRGLRWQQLGPPGAAPCGEACDGSSWAPLAPGRALQEQGEGAHERAKGGGGAHLKHCILLSSPFCCSDAPRRSSQRPLCYGTPGHRELRSCFRVERLQGRPEACPCRPSAPPPPPLMGAATVQCALRGGCLVCGTFLVGPWLTRHPKQDATPAPSPPPPAGVPGAAAAQRAAGPCELYCMARHPPRSARALPR